MPTLLLTAIGPMRSIALEGYEATSNIGLSERGFAKLKRQARLFARRIPRRRCLGFLAQATIWPRDIAIRDHASPIGLFTTDYLGADAPLPTVGQA